MVTWMRSLGLMCLLGACSISPTSEVSPGLAAAAIVRNSERPGEMRAQSPGPAPYTGPTDIGPCAVDSDCRLLSHCGCSCSVILATLQMGGARCRETCQGNPCASRVARCDHA